jgi:hypothetical protein
MTTQTPTAMLEQQLDYEQLLNTATYDPVSHEVISVEQYILRNHHIFHLAA